MFSGHWHRPSGLAPLFLLTTVTISSGCGNSSTDQPAMVAPGIRSEDLYAEMMTLPEDSRLAAATRLGQMSIPDFYAYLSSLATSDPVTIDGVTRPGGRQSLQNDKVVFPFLSVHFHTVSELWRALDFAPNRQSYSSFKADLDLAMGVETNTALELATYSYVQPNDPAREGCDFMKSNLDIDFAVATGIEASVANALTAASNSGRTNAHISGTNGYVNLAAEQQLGGGLYQARGTIRAPRGILSRTSERHGQSIIIHSGAWIQSCFLGIDLEPPKNDLSTLNTGGDAAIEGSCAADLDDAAWDKFMAGLYATLDAAEAAARSQCGS